MNMLEAVSEAAVPQQSQATPSVVSQPTQSARTVSSAPSPQHASLAISDPAEADMFEIEDRFWFWIVIMHGRKCEANRKTEGSS